MTQAAFDRAATRRPWAQRIGAVAAAPVDAFERVVTAVLKGVVRPLWRVLDSYAPTFEKTLARKLIAVLLFPVLMTLSVVLGFAMVERGLNPNVLGYTFLYMLALGLIMAPLERLMPWSRNWLDRQDSGPDLLLMLSASLWRPLLAPVSIFLTAWLVQRIHAELPPGTIRSFWPSELPGVLQVALLLVVMDFFRYWYHRWMHETQFMWRWHSVHHSSTRLYWFNGVRSHPLESFFQDLIWVVPLTLIQAPAEIIFVTALVSRTIGRFQHTNMDAKLGPFEWVFSGPMNHRYHHAKNIEEGNKNYGGDVVIWDHLFGTFYLPKGKQPSDDIGVGGIPDFPQTLLGLTLAPFRNSLWHDGPSRRVSR